MISDTANDRLDFGNTTILRNLSAPRLIELALSRGEAVLASNGALAVGTGDRTGRSPRDKFLEDKKTRSAVIHQIMVIGEAVKRLSREFRGENAGIPWTAIAGMRDSLIHGYDEVDFEKVWQVATGEVPELLARLEPLLPRQE